MVHSLCLPVGQWNSLIGPLATNERRRVDGAGGWGGGEAKRKANSGNDYRFISSFIVLLKRERAPLLYPHCSFTHCATASEPFRRQHPRKAPIGPSRNHARSVLFHFSSCPLADLFHFFNKLFPLLLRPFFASLFLSLFLTIRSIVVWRVPLVNNFPHKIKLGPFPFQAEALAYPGPCLH